MRSRANSYEEGSVRGASFRSPEYGDRLVYSTRRGESRPGALHFGLFCQMLALGELSASQKESMLRE